MKYLSLFSGIEAATVAWKPLGWECVAVSEIEPFPCAVLEHHHGGIPNLGDVTKITESKIRKLGQFDLIVFGSPCQDLSVAGKGKGLSGERSGLFKSAIKIIKWARKHCGCRFALWENVPGAFSTNQSRDFAQVVGSLCGSRFDVPHNGWKTWGAAVGEEGFVEWTVLDAQWFGVPQRRRRVFALVDFGDWSSRPPVLLEPESLRGNPPTRREAGQAVAAPTANGVGTCGANDNQAQAGHLVASDLDANYGRLQGCSGQDLNNGHSMLVTQPALAFSCKDYGADVTEDTSPTLRAMNQVAVVTQYGEETAGTLTARHDSSPCDDRGMNVMADRHTVRRLTPIECERLQGFPDNYTKIPYRNKPADKCPNGPRYKALGNSMAVPVMRWIGKQLEAI